ncbi:MAG: gliding motility-associated C-terminal domain-containing protein, partial [Crocinitomicaceae bacterium]
GTGCEQSVDDYIEFTIDDLQILPAATVAQTGFDVSCDAAFSPTGQATVTVSNGSMTPGDYSYFWYEDAAEMDALDGSNAVTTVTFNADGNVASNLPAGTYYVRVEDENSPGDGCRSVLLDVTIDSFETTITVGSTEDADYDVNPASDCNPLNGAYEVLDISETRPTGTLSIGGGDYAITDYTFDWYYDNAGTLTLIDGTAFPGVQFLEMDSATATANGAAGANVITGLPPGTYFLGLTNEAAANGTGCEQSVDDYIEFTIDERNVDLISIIQNDINPSTFCNDGAPNNGDGTLTVSILEDRADQDPPSNYTLTWYRGDEVIVGNELFAAGNQGTAMDTSPSTDQTELSGLADGFYTLYAQKTSGGSPALGCDFTKVFEILPQEIFPSLNIDDTEITANTICDATSASGMGNGSIVLRADAITFNGAEATDLADYTWSITSSNGSTITPDIAYIAGPTFPTNTAIVRFDNLDPDTYVFSATAMSGCTSSELEVTIQDISKRPSVTLVTAEENQNCVGGDMAIGLLRVQVTDDIDPDGPFTYFWEATSGVNAGNDVSVYGIANYRDSIWSVPDGDYQVTVTNTDTQCSVTEAFTVENIEVNPVITETVLVNKTYCFDNGKFRLVEGKYDGFEMDSTALIAAGYTLEVFEDINLMQPVTDEDPLTLMTWEGLGVDETATDAFGTYSFGTYYATLTHPNSECFDVIEFTIFEEDIVYPLVQIDEEQADISCDDSGNGNGRLVALADGNASGGNYDFFWYEVDVNLNRISGVLETTNILDGYRTGRYEIEVRDNTSQCVISEYPFLSNEPLVPVITALDTTHVTNCIPFNGAISISAMSYGSISDYRFELYDTEPEDGSNPSPIATIAAGNDPVIFNQDSSNPTAGFGPGTYYVQAIHEDLECALSSAREVVIFDETIPPEVSFVAFRPNTRCDITQGNGSITAEGSTPGGTEPSGYSFSWTGVDLDGRIVESDPIYAGIDLNSAAITGIPPGSYVVTVRNDDTGCETISNSYLLKDESPDPLKVTVSTTANSNCANFNGIAAANIPSIVLINPNYDRNDPSKGDSLFYVQPELGLVYEYRWYDGHNLGIDPTNPPMGDYAENGSVIEGLAGLNDSDPNAGKYSLLVLADPNVDNCHSEVIEFTIEDATDKDYVPEVEFTHVTYCYPELRNGYSEVVNTDRQQYSIEWNKISMPAEARFPIQGPHYADSLYAGTYEVVMTNLITGCSFPRQFQIEVDPLATFVPEPSVIVIKENTHCTIPNGEAVATVNGITQNFRFDWYDSNDATTVLFSGSQISTLDEGMYLVKATNTITGCESGLVPAEIKTEIPEVIFEVNATNSFCLRTEDGAINQFNGKANITFETTNFVDSAAWFDESGNRLTYDATGLPIVDGAIGGLSPGKYEVFFVADDGCEYSASFEIVTELRIYNFVTANDDSKNDFFMIDCLDFFPNNTVEIFTRAGQSVYYTEGYNNSDKRFEGLSDRGKPLPDGTYYYIINRGDGSDLLQGYIEILR